MADDNHDSSNLPDERIREEVSNRLRDNGAIDASGIEVTVSSSEVILSGKVKTREDKRQAAGIAEAVPGVRQVQNQLRVDHSDGSSTTRSTSGESMRMDRSENDHQ